MSRWLAGALVRWRWPLLALGLAAAALGWAPARRLDFDRSIENMFAAGDEALAAYDRIKRVFGGNEVVLIAYPDDELLSPAGEDRLRRLAAVAAGTPGVESAVSLANLPDQVRLALGAKLYDLFEGYLLGADRRTAAVVCTLVPESAAPGPRRETLDRLRAAARAEQPEAVLAGAPLMVVDGFRYIEQDGVLLGWASTGLLTATIGLCFRSLRWVALPMAVVHLTLILTQALLVLAQWRLSMVSSMLWAIVTVINVATLIHVIVRYRDFRDLNLSQEDALRECLAEMAAPVTWTVLTDAMGFAALLCAEVGPVRDFGRMMALGSLASLLTLALFVPGLALLAPRFDGDPRRAYGEGLLERILAAQVRAVRRRPWPLAGLLLLLGAAAAAGIPRLRIESDFTSNFRARTEIVQAYEFIERRLGGAGVWDVMAPAPDAASGPAAWDDFLARGRELQRGLRAVRVPDEIDPQATAGLTKVLSLLDVYDAAEGQLRVLAFLSGKHPFPLFLEVLGREQPALLASLWGRDGSTGQTYFRVLLRARERQPSDQKKALIAAVEQVVRRFVAAPVPEIGAERGAGPAEKAGLAVRGEVTGFFVLLTNLIDSLLSDQWITFGAASAAVGLTMLVAFRSLPLALIALVPNVLPILVITGALGWLGVKLNMGAAMIAAVSVGLSVDSSIHYLCEYQRRRAAGRSLFQTLDEVQQGVGRAMVFSTLALIVGFSALAFSNFVPTVYFGVLVGLSMLGGLLGNLVLLPLLLTLTQRES